VAVSLPKWAMLCVWQARSMLTHDQGLVSATYRYLKRTAPEIHNRFTHQLP
jgi:hypothetical protein